MFKNPLVAEVFPPINGVALHTSFHDHPLDITAILLKRMQNDNHPSIHLQLCKTLIVCIHVLIFCETWFIYHIYLAIRPGFHLSNIATNNWISPMKCCYNTNFTFLHNPKDLDPSYEMDQDVWDFWKEKQSLSYNQKTAILYCTAQCVYSNCIFIVFTQYSFT